MRSSIQGKTWEAIKEGESIIFKCKICGFTVRAHAKNYEIAFHEILRHIAESHAKPEY